MKNAEEPLRTSTWSSANQEFASNRAYPLVALFLLMAVAASLAAQLALLRDADLPARELALEGLIFATIGSILGTVVGLHHYRRVEGGLTGGFVGLFVGAIAGPISKIGDKAPLQAIGTAAGCGLTLILFTWAYQTSSRRAGRLVTEKKMLTGNDEIVVENDKCD